MEFKLNESQLAALKKWQVKIKKKHGEYGLFTYSFTPSGIGDTVRVKSHLTEKTLDLSEVEKW
jgi:hypothetical protein